MFGGASQFSFVDLKQKFVYLMVVESDLSGHNWNKLHALVMFLCTACLPPSLKDFLIAE